MKTILRLLACCLGIAGVLAAQSQNSPLTVGASLDGALAPDERATYSIALESGETALVIVRQIGVDLIVDVIDPDGNLTSSVDSPTGRNGNEIVEIHAQRDGWYRLRLRTYDDKEPAGRYSLQYVSRHNSTQTVAIEQAARQWLAARSAPIPPTGIVPQAAKLPPLEQILPAVQVIGLGEATHGSREFGDLRLSLTEWLIEHHGYRMVAIEASESRYATLEAYLKGDVEKNAEITKRIETGWIWIGRRAQRNLIEWVHGWNIQHPHDQVRIAGIDANDNENARKILGPFLQQAYGATAAKRWREAEAELSAADEQSFVFGDSGVNQRTRQFLLEINAILDLDSRIFELRYGSEFESAREAARSLLEFADFNSGGEDSAINHSRDWYMANRVLRALKEGGTSAKVVYWAHNAHVSHPRSPASTAGAILRDVLGCGYVALAVAFGEGAFVAEMPNDLEDRLVVSWLPPSPPGTVEAMLAPARGGGQLTAWECQGKPSKAPEWFSIPRRMHWVGALYKPGTNPAESFRAFDLLNDFDGTVYLPKVTADDVPKDRPLIPARKR